jgi:hypothetical protein
MSNTNTGGPAFPHEYFDRQLNQGRVMHGMTLRDYFAAKAMAADMTDGIHENDFAWAAARAYKVADAMLKAREA